MKRLKKEQQGFTIVEVSIAVVVTGILMTLIFAFMTSSLIQYTNDTNRATILSSAQTGFEVITNDIRLSANSDINNRWPDAYGPGNEFGWASDNDTLVLATAAEDSAGNIIFADPANYISLKNNVVYFLQGGSLHKRILAAPDNGNSAQTTCPAAQASPSCPADRIILENIQEFSVKYIDEQNVEVEPTNARAIELYAKLEKQTFSQPVTVDYTTRMVFRND